MKRRQRQRYLLAVYLLVFVFALIIGYVGVYTADPYQGILINIATELAGVVIIFAVINRFFLIDEWDSSDRIERLLERLEAKERPSAIEFFSPSQNETHRLRTAEQIDLCGISLTAIINEQFSSLQERILNGSNVRLMIIDPETSAVEMAMLRSEARDMDYYRRRVNSVLKDVEYLYDSYQKCKSDSNGDSNIGTLSVRLLPYCPS